MQWPWRKDSAEALRKGEIIRQLHWQCWRADAPPLATPVADLIAVVPVLVESGSVGLVWPRLWHRAEELGAVGAALAAAYESQVAHNALVERDIARVVSRLRGIDAAAGVEPVLIKGFAMARLYPAPLVRTAGDIDLVVPDADYEAAKAALADFRIAFHRDDDAERAQRSARGQREPIEVDLHAFSAWGEAAGDDFFADAPPIQIGGVDVRVPRAEDHLRALCLHFLRHAGVRPLRLCDIALLMEGDAGHRPYNWGRTMRGAEQVAVTLQLAQRLLGADMREASAEVHEQPIPAWLTETVLRQWEENPSTPGPTLQEIMADPGGVMQILSRRWVDPITATLRMDAQFDGRSRWPLQLLAYLLRIVSYAAVRFPRQAVAMFRADRNP